MIRFAPRFAQNLFDDQVKYSVNRFGCRNDVERSRKCRDVVEEFHPHLGSGELVFNFDVVL